MSDQKLESLIARLEKSVARLEKVGGGSGSGDAADAVPPSVSAYDDFVEDYLKPYYTASVALGDFPNKQAKEFQALSDKHRDFLMVVARNAEPKDSAVLQKLLGPMSEAIGKVNKLRGPIEFKNYEKSLVEGTMAFSWVTYPKAPMKFVEGIRDSVKFYTNKILVESKNGDKKEEHRAWVKAFNGIFDGLIDYIKENHRTGPSWNASGPVATEASLSSGVPPPPPAGVPPPPPAGVPPPPPPGAAAPKPSAPAPDVSALLNEINRGADVTKGLRKVEKSQMTHKNPELRKHHTAVPFQSKNTAYKPVGMKKAAAPKRPPKFCLEDGKKWVVEYQEGANLTIDDCNMKQVVYIYKCDKTTIQIKGKVNSVILDSCKKSGLVFNALVSGCEVVNCQSVQVQSQGQCPTVSIDKTDGCIVYLSKECLDCQIVTAKSSEMNVSVPRDDGDYDEHPIVEQFKSYWCPTKKTFVTECVDSLG